MLLVEDESINQLIAREMLTDLGLQATIPGNGQEALDLAAQNTYDLILTDMQMPENLFATLLYWLMAARP